MTTETPETDGEWMQCCDDEEKLFRMKHLAERLECERNDLIRAVRALKLAKGRFHTEQAANHLFNLRR